ncbi:hypothetical protein ACHAWF_014303 [Thalassiosira exigua]
MSVPVLQPVLPLVRLVEAQLVREGVPVPQPARGLRRRKSLGDDRGGGLRNLLGLHLLGIRQRVQQVEVLRRALRQRPRGGQARHDPLPRPPGHRPQDLAVPVRDADVVLAAPHGAVVAVPRVPAPRAGVPGSVGAEAGPSRDGPEEAAVPLVHDLHGDHAPSEAELDGLARAELDGTSEVEVAPVGRSGVREEELAVLESDRGVLRADGAIVQDHVAPRAPSEEEGTGPVFAVGLEEGAEAELEARVEEALGHLVLGGHEEGYVGRLEGGLEELDQPPVLELEVASEGGLADAAGGVDAAEEADLVVRLGGVPLAQALDVYVAGVPQAFAGRDHGVGGGVLFVEAHVADGGVVGGGGRSFARGGVVGIFCEVEEKKEIGGQSPWPRHMPPPPVPFHPKQHEPPPPPSSALDLQQLPPLPSPPPNPLCSK